MKRKILFTITFVALVSILAASSAFSISDDFSFGEKVKKSAESKKAIAKINNEDVTEGQFKSQMLFLEKAKGKKVSNKEVFETIAEKRAQVKEAKAMGIVVTESDLDKYIDSIKQGLQKLEGEERSNYLNSLAGQGYSSEEDYFSDPQVKKAYENSLYIGRLREKILGSLPLVESQKYGLEGQKLLDQKIKEIVSKITIEVLDKSYE